MALWAALHDRPISWACRREHWPVQAWRRALPDQSAMSSRLRDPALNEDFQRLVAILHGHGPAGETLIADGKPLAVSEFTADPEALTGWGARPARQGVQAARPDRPGARRLLAWEVRPMRDSEQAVACELVAGAAARGVLPRGAVLLGDANYDSRHLYAAAAAAGLRLIAPRRLPGAGVSRYPPSHPDRLAAIAALEGDDGAGAARFRSRRATVKRFFGALASAGGGLYALPAWARHLHRVRVWVGAKLALFIARAAPQRAVAA